MCLYTKNIEPTVLNEDLTVYKVVIVKRGLYYSPYMNTLLRESPKGKVNPIVIEEGAIHACSNYTGAEKVLESLKYHYPKYKYVIITGIIPKGTEFWTAYWKEDSSIASKYIKFKLSKRQRFLMRLRDIYETLYSKR